MLITEFKATKQACKGTVRKAKNDWHVKKYEEIHELVDRNDSSAFYKAVKAVYGPMHNVNRPVRDVDSNLLQHEDAITN